MKTLIKLFTALVLVASISSCSKDKMCIRGKGDVENRLISVSHEFEGISYNGSGNVYVTIGTEKKVEVKTHENIFDRVETYVKNDILYMETKGCIRSLKTFDVFITVPSLTFLEMNGSGDVKMENFVQGDFLEIVLNGSGDMIAKANVSSFKAYLNGSGDIFVEGSGSGAIYTVIGSGDIGAYNFFAKEVKASVEGSGEIRLSASEKLTATINGSGDIVYDGNPALYPSVSGSGAIKKR